MGKTVRTTIVGGRPPGEGESIGSTPRGLEVLLKKASLDKAFRRGLLADPEKAARDIQLDLSEAEGAMLRSIPRKALSQMISQVRVPRKQRLAFAGATAAVMLAALGATLTGCEKAETPRGISPDRPPRREERVKGERPDRPPKREDKADDSGAGGVVLGERADRPPKKEEKVDEGEEAGEEATDESPKPAPVTRGISPDRPRESSDRAE